MIKSFLLMDNFFTSIPIMTTSDLSPEAKEFVPLIQIPTRPTTIPLYVAENTIASVYSTDQSLIYPLIKIPEIEFHIPSSTNDNTSQIVLLPTSGCYPGSPMSTFYPIDYPEPSLINYSRPQPKSNQNSSFRTQRGTNHLSYRNSHYDQQGTSLNNHQNFHPTNSKRRSRGIPSPSMQQKKENSNENKSSFALRAEDFPSLPINNQQSDKIPATDTKSTPSWNTVVSTSRSHSVSPSQNQRSDRSPSLTKKPSSTQTKVATSKSIPLTKQPSSQSVSSSEGLRNDQDGFIQTKQQQKRSKQQKNKKKEEPTPSLPEPVPFTLDDENAFPTLGQEISTSLPKKSDAPKDNNSTPGLINKSKIKTAHAYQIRLTDMFNALSTSIQNSHHKTKKSSTTTINSANPLDSKPAPKRGKEREQPKARKPTKLKRIINKELEENQKQRQQLLSKIPTIKQTDEKDIQNETDTNPDDSINLLHINEYTSASGTEESNNESDDDDDDDDEVLDPEPTSQLQTPYSHQMPQSNIKQQIHDAGFREYCSQLIDRQLDELCIQLLLTLKRFQDRKKQQFQSNPERVRGKRRFVHGIREVTKHLRLQRLKCVLIAPDCQSIYSQGGLNDALEQIISLCKEQNIPYIFTLNRQKLGRCLNRISRISTIGIFDYSGADQIYKQIVEITNENQRAYRQILDNILNHEETISTATTPPSHGLNSKEFYKILHRTFQQQQQRHHIVNTIPNESLSKVLPKVPAHYAHSRQTSDTSTIYIDPQLINSIKKQHIRASSGTFDTGGKTPTTKKNHQRTLSDGAAVIDDTSVQIKHHSKTHSRTPSGCSAISQIEQQDYFEQSKNILMMNTNEELYNDNEENRLKSIHEDTEENAANSKRKTVEKWINDN